MAALVDEVDVHVAQGRQEPVGVVDDDRVAAVGDLEPVARNLGPREDADPDALVLVSEVDPLLAVGHHDRFRQWLQRAHGHAVVVRVRSEEGVRVTVLAANQKVELVGRDRLHGAHAATSSAIASRGIDTHDGRLRAS